MVLSEFNVAVTPEASWLISVTKSDKLVWTEIEFPFTVNVLDIVRVLLAAEVNLLKPVALAPWEFAFALIAATKAVAVLFPDVKSVVKFAAKAFWLFILISLAAKLVE